MQSVDVIEGEQWKDVVGYPGYQVSNLGRVSSRWVKGRRTNRIGDDLHLLKQVFKGEHYHRVLLYTSERKRKFWMVHILVMEHFGPPKPTLPGRVLVLHKDDNPDHNEISNLYYGTDKDNKTDALRNGRCKPPSGEKHWNSKLKDEDIPVIKKRLEAGETCQAIANDYGVERKAINKIRLGLSHQHDKTKFTKRNRTADAEDVKRRLANGEKRASIAKDYNVTLSMISQIKSGKRWHV